MRSGWWKCSSRPHPHHRRLRENTHTDPWRTGNSRGSPLRKSPLKAWNVKWVLLVDKGNGSAHIHSNTRSPHKLTFLANIAIAFIASAAPAVALDAGRILVAFFALVHFRRKKWRKTERQHTRLHNVRYECSWKYYFSPSCLEFADSLRKQTPPMKAPVNCTSKRTPRKYLSDVTFVGQRSSRSSYLSSLKVETKFHLECKLCFPCAPKSIEITSQ